MTLTTISTGGGETYNAVWLRAHVRRSNKPDLIIAQLDVPGLIERPTFYVDPSVVEMPPPAAGPGATGRLKAFLLNRRDDGTLVVLVPGESVSYGPQLVVPKELAA